MKRVSIEFNFYILYVNFVDVLNYFKFIILVIKEIFRNIRVSFLDRKFNKVFFIWILVRDDVVRYIVFVY